MTIDSVLLSDQVFQLNTFLWALQELPEGGTTDPVLRRAGYYPRAIERTVLVPNEESIIAALANLLGGTDRSPTRPDLWLSHSSDSTDIVVELKSRGFSANSSDRRQALKIIASAADLAPSLGGQSKQSKRLGHVIYATVASDARALSNALHRLSNMLKSQKIVTAPTSVIEFLMEEDGVALMSLTPRDLPKPAADVLSSPAIVLKLDGENDLQPLYFVPWIPGIQKSQNAELSSAGLAELTARVLSHALAKIGQANAPRRVVLDGFQLLDAATFGVFEYWRSPERKQFGKTVAEILMKALTSIVEVVRLNNHTIEVDLPESVDRDRVIDRLEQADPFDPASNLETAEQLTLDLGVT
ncbi:hypothetical protein [Candidatus Poriferisodalis sp.]|uniref:hypothetical protein n=1 Tax=Candidatus Poriferisodalis sp. TaxID=3101277 RepID=UPI003B0194AF